MAVAEKRIVKANRPQGQFLALPHKFRAFVAGYGSGKTWVTGMSSCINYAKFPKVNQGYFAPTYPQIRDIFYPTIEEVAGKFGFNVNIKFGNKEVHFYRGDIYLGTTLCRSMDKPETIVGFKIGHATIDELDTLNTEKADLAWKKIIARLRYDVYGLKNGADIATTPEGFKFTYQTFVKQLIERPELNGNYGIIHASTYENEKNLPDDYISSLFEAYPEQLRDAYINGQFVNLTSGTVFYAFDRKKHDSNEEITGYEPLYIGMDFNVDHMAATIYVQRGNVWHAVEELKDIFDTPEMARIINDRWGKRRNITIYPDASGKNRKSVGASESDLSILRSYGFQIKAKSRNPFVKDRINATNKAFEDCLVMVNCRKCPTVASCLEQQAYDKNGEPDKKSGFDHQNDATTYPIAYEMPINKPDYNNLGSAMPAGFKNPKPEM